MSRDKLSIRLADVVQVNQQSIRSINIERTIRSSGMIRGYVFTPQAQQSFKRIVSQLASESTARSWTLTGPYGSGKSYFGLFLSSVLSKDAPDHDDAITQLATINPFLFRKVEKAAQLQQSQGFFLVPIVAFRDSIQEVFKSGFQEALKAYRDHTKIAWLLGELNEWDRETDSRTIVSWLERLLAITKELNYTGVVVLLDEMGKVLEYAAQYPDASDLFLLQEIAELANSSNDPTLLLIGMLHQSFAGYAHRMDITLQREWMKIQGRFEDIAFQEPVHQQIWLLANAIEHLDVEALIDVTPAIEHAAYGCVNEEWIPAQMGADDFVALSKLAYPLHPTTLVALPYVFRRLAQNERSMFAYLASHEPYGFQEMLEKKSLGEFIRLPEIFDYLTTNFQPQLYANTRARPITEAIESLSTAPHLDDIDVQVIKTISILNWLGQISPLTATEDNIVLALNAGKWSIKQIQETLEQLRKRSFIVFRRYNGTYVIWQGSDVDIEERLREARSRLTGQFSIAEAIGDYLPPQPVVARRHSYQKGTTRAFQIRYVDPLIMDQLDLTVAPYYSGLVLLCLAPTRIEARRFAEWAQSEPMADRNDILIGILSQTSHLHDLLSELRAVRWVQENTPELRDDPVARKELRIRAGDLEPLIVSELERSLNLSRINRDGNRWFYAGEDVTARSHRSLAHLLSDISDRLYDKSPVIKNEIINRRVLSSQGAAARRNLIQAILEHEHEERLGIEGYPPELSIYESLLRASGLHRLGEDGIWHFGDVPTEDPLGLTPVWRVIHDYIFTPPYEPRPVDVLYAQLEAPPYGLTPGVLPILLAVFLQVYRDEATLYREGTLIPEPGIVDWELLLRRPELYAVAGARVTGPRRAIIERLARGLRTQPAPLPIVRELIRQLKRLPDYAWRTKKLSSRTLAVRDAIANARSPEKLLFEELPEAVDIPPFGHEGASDSQDIEVFFERLNQALQELMKVTPRLINRSRDALLEAFEFPQGEEGWDAFVRMARELAPKVTHPQLLPLLLRASDGEDSQQTLESVLAYVVNRPPRKWTDRDEEIYLINLETQSSLFRMEQALHFPDAGLSERQRERSHKLAKRLQQDIQAWNDDPEVIQAALRMLLKQVETMANEKGEDA